MRVAAYQAPLVTAGLDALDLVRTQVKRCESERVTVLCCPEAILGGLADNHPIRRSLRSQRIAPRSRPRLLLLRAKLSRLSLDLPNSGMEGRSTTPQQFFSEGKSLACIASCILRSAGRSIRPVMAFASSGSESSHSA